MHKENQQLYEFGPFHLDLGERLLMRDGRVVPLSPKVFETLSVLVKNSGRIVSKDELMRLLWPDTFVEESNLTQNISQIRRALGEGGSETQYIETIPKRGYRFVAPVQPVLTGENGSASLGNGAGAESFALTTSQVSLNGAANDLSVTAQPQPRNVLARVALLCVSLGVLGAALFVAQRRTHTLVETAFQRVNPARLTTTGKAGQAALSRDGKYVAYVVEEGDLQGLSVRQVATPSQTMVVMPAALRFKGVTFSPDDNFIYYVVYPGKGPVGELCQVPVLGGTPKKIMADVDSPISFAPDGQSFAFVRIYPQHMETALLVARLDGSGERKLVTRKRPEMLSSLGPSWSPDGKLIACAAGAAAGGEASMSVLAVNVADATARPIGAQTWTTIGQVAWLGDGSGLVLSAWRRTSAVYGDQLWLLAYPQGAARRLTNDMTSYEGVSLAADASALISRRIDRVSRIWIVPGSSTDFDTAKATQIQSGFGDNYSERFGLEWTPDGRLVYATHASGNLDVWLTTTDGKQPKQLTRDPLTDIAPTVSADGRHVVFVSERSDASSIWRMDIDGGNLKQLTNGNGDYGPTLSPDNQWVVYSSWNSGQPALWKVPFDGGAPVQLSPHLMSRPLISPDGKWIACYYQTKLSAGVKIALLPFAGGEPVIIEQLKPPEFGLLRWTPDSSGLTYIVTRQGVSNLWRQPLDGGAAQPLTDFTSDQIFRFAWSRDGKYLACERGQSINDIVLLSSVKAE